MKLPERGPCRRGPWKGNVKSAATLVEGLVDRFSDASSTLAASTKQGLEPICAPSLFFCLKTLTFAGFSALRYSVYRAAAPRLARTSVPLPHLLRVADSRGMFRTRDHRRAALRTGRRDRSVKQPAAMTKISTIHPIPSRPPVNRYSRPVPALPT